MNKTKNALLLLRADQSDIPVSAILRRPLPATNLYFMQITRIHSLKTGPFHEHSSQLYAIANGVPYWTKVNSGLLKMYEVSIVLRLLHCGVLIKKKCSG
jgi:serine/threonine-protein phosphatase 2A activator